MELDFQSVIINCLLRFLLFRLHLQSYLELPFPLAHLLLL